MTADEIRALVRTYAVEVLAVNQLAIYCLTNAPSDPQAAVSRMREQMLAGARGHAFPDLDDPAMSDFASAELEDAMSRLMEMASAQIAVVLKAREARGS